MLYKNKLMILSLMSIIFIVSCSNDMKVESSAENADGGTYDEFVESLESTDGETYVEFMAFTRGPDFNFLAHYVLGFRTVGWSDPAPTFRPKRKEPETPVHSLL